MQVRVAAEDLLAGAYQVRRATAHRRRIGLLDHARNFLGHFRTREDEAEAALLRYVEADARAAGDLELWHDETTRVAVDSEKLRRTGEA